MKIIIRLCILCGLLYSSSLAIPNKLSTCQISAREHAMYARFKSSVSFGHYDQFQDNLQRLMLENKYFQETRLIQNNEPSSAQHPALLLQDSSCIVPNLNADQQLEAIVFMSHQNRLEWQDAKLLELMLHVYDRTNLHESNDLYKIANHLTSPTLQQNADFYYTDYQAKNTHSLYLLNKKTQKLTIFVFRKSSSSLQ